MTHAICVTCDAPAIADVISPDKLIKGKAATQL